MYSYVRRKTHWYSTVAASAYPIEEVTGTPPGRLILKTLKVGLYCYFVWSLTFKSKSGDSHNLLKLESPRLGLISQFGIGLVAFKCKSTNISLISSRSSTSPIWCMYKRNKISLYDQEVLNMQYSDQKLHTLWIRTHILIFILVILPKNIITKHFSVNVVIFY